MQNIRNVANAVYQYVPNILPRRTRKFFLKEPESPTGKPVSPEDRKKGYDSEYQRKLNEYQQKAANYVNWFKINNIERVPHQFKIRAVEEANQGYGPILYTWDNLPDDMKERAADFWYEQLAKPDYRYQLHLDKVENERLAKVLKEEREQEAKIAEALKKAKAAERSEALKKAEAAERSEALKKAEAAEAAYKADKAEAVIKAKAAFDAYLDIGYDDVAAAKKAEDTYFAYLTRNFRNKEASNKAEAEYYARLRKDYNKTPSEFIANIRRIKRSDAWFDRYYPRKYTHKVFVPSPETVPSTETVPFPETVPSPETNNNKRKINDDSTKQNKRYKTETKQRSSTKKRKLKASEARKLKIASEARKRREASEERKRREASEARGQDEARGQQIPQLNTEADIDEYIRRHVDANIPLTSPQIRELDRMRDEIKKQREQMELNRLRYEQPPSVDHPATILGLNMAELEELNSKSPNECCDLIKKKYKKLTLIYHPDKQNNKTEAEILAATQKFKLLTNAFDTMLKMFHCSD